MRVNTTTFSIVAGSSACNAKCPFCVAKMTPKCGIDDHPEQVNWRNFDKACEYARNHSVNTALITGKGEPTLYPEQITSYLHALRKHEFPFVELQTNGIEIENNPKYRDYYLKQWHYLGLTTVALSVIGASIHKSNECMQGSKAVGWWNVTEAVHEAGLSVRLSSVICKGYGDSWKEISALIKACQMEEVEQLTLRRIGKPEECASEEIKKWVDEHFEMSEDVYHRIRSEFPVLMRLPHGAEIYDIEGQNVCLTNCLTLPNEDEIRQLIFFPDGHLRYDWSKKGALLL